MSGAEATAKRRVVDGWGNAARWGPRRKGEQRFATRGARRRALARHTASCERACTALREVPVLKALVATKPFLEHARCSTQAAALAESAQGCLRRKPLNAAPLVAHPARALPRDSLLSLRIRWVVLCRTVQRPSRILVHVCRSCTPLTLIFCQRDGKRRGHHHARIRQGRLLRRLPLLELSGETSRDVSLV